MLTVCIFKRKRTDAKNKKTTTKKSGKTEALTNLAVEVLTGTWTLSLQLGGKLGISENKRLVEVTTPEGIEDLELPILRNQKLENILFNF